MKRILLFILTNVAVLVVVTAIVSLLGLDTAYLKPHGLDLTALAIFSLIWGMVGSVISLLMSKQIAKWTMKLQVIKAPHGPQENFIFDVVQRLANQHGIKTPELAVYNDPTPNAFATGASKNSSLVAVSVGLLQQMNNDEIEGVIAHEMAHIVNGDMVTMTLVQGVMNAFVIFFSRIAAYAVQTAMGRDGEQIGGLVYYVVAFAFQILFGMLASLVVFGFSRHREYAADRGSAQMVGKAKMIAALKRLQQMQGTKKTNKAFATMQISGSKSGMMELFRTHPPLEKRIAALRGA